MSINIIQSCDLNQLKYFIESEFPCSFSGRRAKCPFHDDKHESFSVFERFMKAKARCFTCDKTWDILDLAQNRFSGDILEVAEALVSRGYLAESDLNIQQSNKEEYKKTKDIYSEIRNIFGYTNHYKYFNNGVTAFKIKLLLNGRKSFTWKHLDKYGNLSHGKGEIGSCIYGLKSRYSKEDVLYILEGEKDVETARKCGLNAIHIEGKLGDAEQYIFDRIRNAKEIRIILDDDTTGFVKSNEYINALKERKFEISTDKYIKQVRISNYGFFNTKKFDFTDMYNMCGSSTNLLRLVDYFVFAKTKYSVDEVCYLSGFKVFTDAITQQKSYYLFNVFNRELHRLIVKGFLEKYTKIHDIRRVETKMQLVTEINFLKDAVEEASNKDQYINDAENYMNHFVNLVKTDDQEYSNEVLKHFLMSSASKLVDETMVSPIIIALYGEQQCGKSKIADAIIGNRRETILRKYFSQPSKIDDSLRSLDVIGSFFIHLDEDSAISGSSIDSIKTLSAKRTSLVRPAYSPVEIEKKVYGNIIITTNNEYILRDKSGNRRIFVMNVIKDDPEDMRKRISQIEKIDSFKLLVSSLILAKKHKFHATMIEDLKDKYIEKDNQYKMSHIANWMKKVRSEETTHAYTVKDIQEIIAHSPLASTVEKDEAKYGKNNVKNAIDIFMKQEELDKSIYCFKSSVKVINKETGQIIIRRNAYILPLLDYWNMTRTYLISEKVRETRINPNSDLHMPKNEDFHNKKF